MAAKVGTILITEYVYGPSEELQGTLQKGISTDDVFFSEVASDNPKADDGVNTKITYRNDPTTLIYTDDTVATLVAKSNGTVSASV